MIGVCVCVFICDTRTKRKTGRRQHPKCYCWFGRQWPGPWRCPPTRSLAAPRAKERCAFRLSRSWPDENWFASTPRIINGECLAQPKLVGALLFALSPKSWPKTPKSPFCAHDWVSERASRFKKKQAIRTHARRTQACRARKTKQKLNYDFFVSHWKRQPYKKVMLAIKYCLEWQVLNVIL